MIAAAPSYLEQAPEVRARFGKLKQRPVILEVRDLSKTFAAPGRPPTLALDRLSFRLHRRELACVIGPSGCGKSTLARLVAGLEQPSARRDAARRKADSRARVGSRHGVPELHAVPLAHRAART